MFSSYTLCLKALKKSTLSVSNAKAVHGMFLKELSDVNPDLATLLHDTDAFKPFTLSALKGKNLKQGTYYFEEGSHAEIRLTLLNKKVFTAFFMAFDYSERSVEKQILIKNTPFEVVRIEECAREERLEFLMEPPQLAPQSKFELHFHAPTCFRIMGSRTILFPEPRNIVKTLAMRWNYIFPEDVKLSESEIERLGTGFYPSRYNLKTEILNTGNSPMIGFKGSCQFELSNDLNSNDLLILERLLRLSNYTGIGYKTTMGFGHTEFSILPLKTPQPLSKPRNTSDISRALTC